MKKRIFSAALAGCMMLTMVPVTAFAAEKGAESVTEVAVEQYAAGKATLERTKFTDEFTKVGTLGLTDFMEDDADKTLKPVTGYTDFCGESGAGAVALQNGYYLPLRLTVPGANAKTQVIIKDRTPVNYDDPYASRSDLTVSGNGTYDHKTEAEGEKDVLDLLVQVARLDGIPKRDSVDVDVYVDGENTAAEDVQHLSFDLTGLKLKPSKYMEAKLDICTEATKTFSGKKATDLYDASTKTVKKVSGYTGYSSDATKQSGYFLPFYFELDGTAAQIVVKGKAPNGAVEEKPAVTVTDGKVELVARVADADGKMLWDALEVVIYPEGKDEDGKLLSKTLTYDLSDVALAADGVEMGARLPEVNKVTGENYLAYRNNLTAVKSVALRNGVLTVTADLNSLADGVTTIPVLFTMTKDGKSIVKAQPSVVNYGGTSLTDYVAYVDLRANETAQKAGVVVKDTANADHKVEFKIINASKVPVLEDSTVKVENGTMTGMTAEATAKSAADVKAMYKENGGTVTVTTAAGVTMADDAAVGTGCLVVLKDRDGNVIDTITVVVKGDVRGNGVMGLGQLVAAAQAVKGTAPLTGPYLAAGDFNGDGAISLGDLVGMAGLLK